LVDFEPDPSRLLGRVDRELARAALAPGEALLEREPLVRVAI
jgi:hypothetical protein